MTQKFPKLLLARLGALLVFLLLNFLLSDLALDDIQVGNTYDDTVVGYAPMINTSFFFLSLPSSATLSIQWFFLAFCFLLAFFVFRKRGFSDALLTESWLAIGVILVSMIFNFWQRLSFGGVIDYLKIGPTTFNLADFGIIGGAAVLLARVYFFRRSEA
ncbi:signal peptidase II [Candidatus Uhrbacteria bacterium]|nr:signal peptidase II [Candidatus Uhrbacteria bacterium]